MSDLPATSALAFCTVFHGIARIHGYLDRGSRTNRGMVAAMAVMVLTATSINAAVVHTTSSSAVELAYSAEASSADLLHGLTAITTGWNTGNNADPQEIHDGVHGNTYNTPPTDKVQGGWTTVGATAEYNLGLGANGLGYDITNIQSIAAWNGAGFGNQGWTVEVKLKDAGSYTTLATVDYQALGGADAGATKVVLTDDSTGVLASGVEYIKVTANSVNGGANAGAFVWRELDVMGVETGNSEPGIVSWSAMGLSNITAISASAYATLGGANGMITLYWKQGATHAPYGHGGWDGSNGPSAASTGLVVRAMSGLMPDTWYTCVFYATNSVNSNEAWMAAAFATDLTPAQAPVFTNVVAVGASVTLAWQDNAATETGYVLQRSNSGSAGPYSVVATLPANSTYHLDGGLSSGTYHYRLAATNSGNGSVSDFPACQTNVVVTAPVTPLRIMALGDSITAGYTDNPFWNHPFMFGYRSGLYTRLTNAGYNFKFVGESTEPWTGISGDPTHGGTYTPALDLRDVGQDGHRGYGGSTIGAINSGVAGYIAADDPDIILLSIGINGIGAGSQAALNTLVTNIVTTAPDVHLIVAQITPLASFNQALYDYNVYIRDTLVPAYAGSGYKVTTVDLYSLFLTDTNNYASAIAPGVLANNINHPDNPHYDLMAQTWFDGIESLGLTPSAATPGRTRVFLLGGQSNMKGQGTNSELTAPYDTAQTNVAFWDNGDWVDLAPGFGNTSAQFGPEVSFGYTVKQALPPDRILLVKYAANDTALYNDWAPPSGPEYSVFTNTAHAALANLDAKGVDYEISAMLWLQGESDALEGQGAAYETNLRNFIADMRTQFNVPDLPFYIARVRTYYGTPEQAGLVRTAQVGIAESMTNVEWFDTDSYNPLIDGGHYNTAGQINIGIDFANTYLASGPSGTFSGWANEQGLDGTTGKESGFSDDPDGDGVVNGFEWISGGNPLVADSGSKGLVPTLSSSSMFGIAFTREEDSIERIDLYMDWSTNLMSAWSNSISIFEHLSGSYSKTNGVVVTIDDAPDPDSITVLVPDAFEDGRSVFFRLKASQP